MPGLSLPPPQCKKGLCHFLLLLGHTPTDLGLESEGQSLAYFDQRCPGHDPPPLCPGPTDLFPPQAPAACPDLA